MLRRPLFRRVALLAALAVGTGGGALVLSESPTRGELRPPQIAITSKGLRHVLYSEVARGGLRLASERQPGVWGSEVVSPRAESGGLALSHDGEPMAAYTTPDGLVVATRTRGVWHRELVDPRGEGTPAVATAPDGTVRVLYNRSGSDRLALARSRRGEPRWVRAPSLLRGTRPQIATDGRHEAFAAERGDIVSLSIDPQDPQLSAETSASVRESPATALALAGGRPALAYLSYLAAEAHLVRAVPRAATESLPELTLARSSLFPVTFMGGSIDAAGTRGGTVALLYREAFRGRLRVSMSRAGRTVTRTSVGPGRDGAITMDPRTGVTAIAYWDLGGRVLQVPESFRPGADISTPTRVAGVQPPFPMRDRLAVWLAALVLLAAVLAGTLILHSALGANRLLPFLLPALVLAGAAIRAVYVAESGRYGIYPHDTFALDGPGVRETVTSVLLLAIAFAVLAVVGVLVGSRGRLRSLIGKLAKAPLPGEPAARWTAVVLTAVAVASLTAVIVTSGGLSALAGQRQAVFENRGYVTLLIAAPLGSFVLYLAACQAKGTPLNRRLVAGLSVTLVLLSLATGTRSTLLRGLLAPVVLYVHLAVRPFSMRVAVTALALFAVVGLGYRVLIREPNQPPEALPVAPLVEDGVSKALRPVLDGPEARYLDGLIVVRREFLPRFGPRPFRTVEALAALPVPRRWWQHKPTGAMVTFTRATNPYRYDATHSGVTTSLAGDFALNGGIAGVLIGFALFGLYLGLLGELAAGTAGVAGLVLACVLIPRTASATWGDVHGSAIGALTVGSGVVLALVAGIVLNRRMGRSGSPAA